jgi:uncharacterized integral membrane protein
MKIYKIIALVGGIITILLSILFNNRQNQTSVQFTVSYYPFFFIALVYFIGGVTILYMLFKISFVIRTRGSFFNFLNSGEADSARKNVISLFVQRHIGFIFTFLCCYVPNNIILLMQIFMSYKICVNCSYYSVCLYLMSLSCTISFIIKLTEPYMQKYIKVVINFLFRKESDEDKQNVDTDYVDLYANSGLIDQSNNNGQQMYNLEEGKSVAGETSFIPRKPKNKLFSTTEFKTLVDPLNLFTKEMEASDFFVRMIGITIATEEDKQFDFDPEVENRMKAYLPWEDDIYNSKSKFLEYTNKNIPEWITAGELSKFND